MTGRLLTRGFVAALLGFCLLAALWPAAASAAGGDTIRLGLGYAGQGNGDSFDEAVSADGRYVAFTSDATNLVPGDTNGKSDVFVQDRVSGAVTRVSTATGGAESNGDSQEPQISADGRYVTFASTATNLVSGDTNGEFDVFVHDRATGTTSRVSVSSAGVQADKGSLGSVISGDGRYIAFQSLATNLVVGDTNDAWDVFLRDQVENTTRRVSVRTVRIGDFLLDVQGDAYSSLPAISADGKWVAFTSGATNLIAADENGHDDVFVREIAARSTTRVSVGSGAVEGDANSQYASLSSDGRFVAFMSKATNLVTGDTNAKEDVFVRDLTGGTTVLASVGAGGVLANDRSYQAHISSDGHRVAFATYASNLVTGDTNGQSDCFLRDLTAGTTSRISVGSSGAQGNNGSAVAVLSADGRYALFESEASDLVTGDTNGKWDVFLRQLTSEPVLLSLSATSPKWGAPASLLASVNEVTPPNVPVTGRTVVLQRLVSGTWNDVSSTVTAADGTAMFSVPLSSKSSFRTRFDAVPGKLDAGFSPALTIAPKVSIGTPVAPKTMKKGRYYTVYGSLKPRHTKGTKPVRIYKYKKVDGKWKSYGYVRAKAYNYKTYSRYKVKMRLTSKGSWRLRAYAPGDSKHAATWSTKYDYVKVK